MIVRRPNLSTIKKAGIDIANMRIPDTPEATNEAVPLERPACAKRVGAYYLVVSEMPDFVVKRVVFVRRAHHRYHRAVPCQE